LETRRAYERKFLEEINLVRQYFPISLLPQCSASISFGSGLARAIWARIYVSDVLSRLYLAAGENFVVNASRIQNIE
jgi:hypothetical protein